MDNYVFDENEPEKRLLYTLATSGLGNEIAEESHKIFAAGVIIMKASPRFKDIKEFDEILKNYLKDLTEMREFIEDLTAERATDDEKLWGC